MGPGPWPLTLTLTLTFGLWPADVSHREGIGRRYGLCRCNFDAPVAPGEVKGGARMNENADEIVKRRGLDVSRGSKVTEGMSLLTYLSLLASAGIATSLLARWLLQA